MEAIGGSIDRDSIQKIYPKTDFRFIYYEDAFGGQPDLQKCMQWALSHDVDPAMVLMDWGGAVRGSVTGATFEDDAGEVAWCVDETQLEVIVPMSQIPTIDNSAGYDLGQGMATTWRRLDPYLSDYNVPATPWYAIMDGANMEYLFNSGKDPHWWFEDKLFEIIYK